MLSFLAFTTSQRSFIFPVHYFIFSHRLEGLDSKAYEAFQASRNLRDVVDRVLAHRTGEGGKLQVKAQLMTPVLPMLAEACKSVDFAFKRVSSLYLLTTYPAEHKCFSRLKSHKLFGFRVN